MALEAVPVFLYFLISIAFFLPVVLDPFNVFLGSFVDISITLQSPAYLQYNLQHGVNSTRTDLLNAPFGTDISQLGSFFVFTFIVFMPLAAATSLLFAYNATMFSFTLLSAIAAYFLARHFIKSRQACFISGLIYGFSPYFLARVFAGHTNLLPGAFIAFFILALFRFEEKKTYFNALFLAVTLALVGFTSEYYFFFSVIFAAIFFLYKMYSQRRHVVAEVRKAANSPVQFIKQQRHYFAAAAMFGLIFLVTIFPLVLTIVSTSSGANIRQALGIRTNLMNLVYLSAWPPHFVTPPVYHPLFKPAVSEFLGNTLVGMNFIGATVFLGFTALALSFVAIIKQKKNKAVRFFLFASIAVFIIATGPFVRYAQFFGLTLAFVPALLAFYSHYCGCKKLVKAFALIFILLLFFPLLYPLLPSIQGIAADITGLQQLRTYSADEIIEHLEKYSFLPIPMPSFFLFKAVPFFRAYGRLAVLLILCIAVLAGSGAQALLQKAKSAKKRNLLALGLSALILFESINFPPYIATNVSEIPPEYKWLAEQQGSTIVLEYPLSWNNVYFFYQMYHMQPLMNGLYSEKFDRLHKHIIDPIQETTLSLLSGLGVKYIIVHDDFFIEQIPDALPDKRIMQRWMSADKSRAFAKQLRETQGSIAGIRLVQQFPHATIFAVTAEPMPTEEISALIAENSGQ